MYLSSVGKSTSSAEGDYVGLIETVDFQGTDIWTRTDIDDDGDYRYVLEQSGQMTIIDDAIVEGPETFEIVLQRTPGDVALFAIKGDAGEQRQVITIQDMDKFGIGVTVSKDVVPLGETTNVTLTFQILDGAGAPQGERPCILASALADVSTSIAGTASTSDYSYTVESGSITDIDFDECEETPGGVQEQVHEAVLAITVPDTAVKGRTITFTPTLAMSHDDLDTGLLEGATIAIGGKVPPAVTGVEVEPGNEELVVSWTRSRTRPGMWSSGSQGRKTTRQIDARASQAARPRPKRSRALRTTPNTPCTYVR